MKKIIYLVIIIAVISLLTILIFSRTPDNKPMVCEMQNCHGLDISCGPDAPEVCTMIYQAGDGCRQFASCQIVNEDCKPILSEEFNKCKQCVQDCYKKYPSDDLETTDFFECESQCMYNL